MFDAIVAAFLDSKPGAVALLLLAAVLALAAYAWRMDLGVHAVQERREADFAQRLDLTERAITAMDRISDALERQAETSRRLTEFQLRPA